MNHRAVAAAVGVGLAVNRPDGPDWAQVFEALHLAAPDTCAVHVTGWDPVASTYTVIAEHGYPPGVSADLTGMHRSLWGGWLKSADRPLLIDDEGLGFRTSPHYRDWLGPAGYEDGLGVCLRDGDGSPVGFVQMSARRPNAFGEPVRAFVGEIARILAPHADPLHAPRLDAAFDGAWSGNRLAPDGRVLTLGRRSGSPLAHDHRIAALAHRFAAMHAAPLTFIWPNGREWLRVALVGGDNAGRGGVLLLTRPYANDCGLSPREVDVLTGIVVGRSNAAIADLLTIGRRTVDTYVERLMAKLGCSSRAELAAVATRNGLVRPDPEPGAPGDVAALVRVPTPRTQLRA